MRRAVKKSEPLRPPDRRHSTRMCRRKRETAYGFFLLYHPAEQRITLYGVKRSGVSAGVDKREKPLLTDHSIIAKVVFILSVRIRKWQADPENLTTS